MAIAEFFAPDDALAADLLALDVLPTGDGAHDLSHILRVWRNVQQLVAQEGGDTTILTAATLLHDCVNLPKDAPDRAMASRYAAEKATEILTQLRWQIAQIERVAHAIEAHSFSAKITPLTLEAKILQDADRLDAMGHIGIARCFHVSGQLDRSICDLNDPMAKDRALDDHAFALDHFHTKLLHLAEGFQTPTGRKLAAGRHTAMQSFVDGLIAEVAP